MPDTRIGRAELDAKRAIRRKHGTGEEPYIGKRGHYRKYREDGSYTWGYRFQPNEGGRLTREARHVGEAEGPQIRAEAEYHSATQAGLPRVALKDAHGAVQYVDPGLAEATARRNGWNHAWRVGGNRVEVGIDGMLFREIAGRWDPTGRWCIGTPNDWSKPPKGGRKDGSMICRGIQRDPSGVPWRGIGDSWEMIQ